jgi:AcrR family transcriptional regulator
MSATDIDHHSTDVRDCHQRAILGLMSRWEPDAQGRLQRAAIELFLERGFEQTTVAEIARRAGLTERTFFRYFTDKREVLFAGSEALHETLVRAVREAPPSMAPIDVAGEAVAALAALFEGRHEHARLRSRIIAAHAELQERELIKMASLRSALAEALRQRGVAEHPASLLADLGIAVFHNAFARWVSGTGGQTFAEVTRKSLRELKSVSAGT